MAKKVIYEYDYNRITLSFRNDSEKQKKASEYLTAVSTHKRTDFIASLILEYVSSYGITTPEELAKVVKSGRLFEKETTFSDEQSREIKMLIAEFLGKKGMENLSSSVVHTEQSKEKKEKINATEKPVKTSQDADDELSSAEANVLADMMNMFS